MTATEKTLLVVVGPTAVGKTSLTIELARQYQAPILSADSRQMYAPLKIGTAAPTAEELRQAPHHFVGHLAVDQYYSAAQYEIDAIAKLCELFATHNVVLLTGGSMMYVDAVCYGIDDIPTIDTETRQFLEQHHQTVGLAGLCEELRLVDPTYYQTVDLRNPKRVIHALEVYYMTGRTFSSFRSGKRKERPFRIIKIGLNRPREELYARINQRVEQMADNGLLAEAQALYPYRTLNALNTVGYKEMFAHLDGECTLSEALTLIKQHTRQYARKQLTWFKRDNSINWFAPHETTAIIEYINTQLSLL